MKKDRTQVSKIIFKSNSVLVLNEDTGEIVKENIIRREKTNEVIDVSFVKLWPEFLVDFLVNCGNRKCIILGYLLSNKNRMNQINKTQRQISDETGICLPTVNKALLEMKKLNIILIQPGMIMLNPDFIAYGSSKVRNELREKYDKIKNFK